MPLVTLSDWIETTRRHMTSGRQNERNVLASGYTAGSGTLTVANPLGGIVAGTRLSVGLNVLYVTAVSSVGLSASVIGGQEGSTDANASAGALVRVNPTVTDFEITEALAADLSDLSAPATGLFRVATSTLAAAYSTALMGMDLVGLAATLTEVEEVRWLSGSDATNWVALQQLNWTLERDANVTSFPSGLGLLINDSAGVPNGATIQVVYRAGFTPVYVPTDALSVTGLPATAYDLPPIGAAMRLMFPREAKRNETKTQGDTRRAGEVPPGALLNSARGLAAWRSQRIASEMQRLLARYPSRRW